VANTMAELCEKIGADWSEIVPALKLDKRIGQHAYLAPGLGLAGGNLERDLTTVEALAAETGSDAALVTAWRRNSAYRRDWALRILHREGILARGMEASLGVWGVAYKADTHSIKNSQSVDLLRALRGFRISTYDPAAKLPGDNMAVRTCDSPVEAASGADALAVMTPWSEFTRVPLEHVRAVMRGSLILDPYGILDEKRCRSLGLDYHRLGV